MLDEVLGLQFLSVLSSGSWCTMLPNVKGPPGSFPWLEGPIQREPVLHCRRLRKCSSSCNLASMVEHTREGFL